jgi:transcriptional regulator with XRE-family HTH domain
MKDIHIGSIIKQKFTESSMTIKEFSNKINCDRTTVYDIFKRKSIDVEKLIKISQVLNYNFIEEIYFKRNSITISIPPTIFIAVEIDKHLLKNLNLPNNFIQLIKDIK